MKTLMCKKKGFTLVEILVVIMIVGMLSVLAVSGYTQYRRSTLLDFSVDSLISQMYALRDKTIHGDFDSTRAEKVRQAVTSRADTVADSDSEAKCYGLYFYGGSVDSFELKFSNQKKWDGAQWAYEGCQAFNTSLVLTPFELDNMFSVAGDLVLIFSPPDGKMNAQATSGTILKDDIVKLIAKYGVGDEVEYKREILIDLTSGKITVNRL